MFGTIFYYLFTVILFSIFLFLCIVVVIMVVTEPFAMITRLKSEGFYTNPVTGAREKFPSIGEEPSCNISVVVPAFNEEKRLPPMLDEALEYLELQRKSNPDYKYEIIVVSDGSSDGTVKIAESYSQRYGTDKVRCMNLVTNRGKGGAVKLGVLCSRGATILFADADGASKFADLSKLQDALQKLVCSDKPEILSDASAIMIGSRAHLEKDSLASRSVFRTILMYGFHFLVWLFTVRNIKDTQCGFKLFTRKAAQVCFDSLHVERWAFDVELLYIAQKLDIPIYEISVRWTEIDGSKVTPVWSWIQMGCDLALIWLRYAIGAWQIKVEKVE